MRSTMMRDGLSLNDLLERGGVARAPRRRTSTGKFWKVKLCEMFRQREGSPWH